MKHGLTQIVNLKPTIENQKLAARLGFEPRQADSESAVLPLHHEAVRGWEVRRGRGDVNRFLVRGHQFDRANGHASLARARIIFCRSHEAADPQ